MNPFLRNPQAFKRTPPRAEVPDVKASDGVATLRLYDPVDSYGGWWGISAKEFVAAVDELPEDTNEIRLLINSPGGEAWDALAILNSLRAHPAKVTAVVEGIAASAASFIAVGVDELHVMENAELMVHKAWGMAIGNGDDMTKMAADLGHLDRNLASIYAGKSGGSVDDWLDVMAAETWYSAQEAVEAGLADKMIPARADADAEQARNRFDLSIFAHAGRSHAPAPRNISAGDEAGTTGKEGSMPTLKESLAERFGFDPAADDETVIAAVDEALNEQVENDSGGGESQEQSPEQVTAAAARLGLTLVDRAQYDATVSAAEEGRQARAQQVREADERVVDARIRDGAIAPAARAGWLAALDADRKLPAAQQSAKATLDGLPKGLIPVAEVGHSQEVDPDAAVIDNPVYKEWRL